MMGSPNSKHSSSNSSVVYLGRSDERVLDEIVHKQLWPLAPLLLTERFEQSGFIHRDGRHDGGARGEERASRRRHLARRQSRVDQQLPEIVAPVDGTAPVQAVELKLSGLQSARRESERRVTNPRV